MKLSFLGLFLTLGLSTAAPSEAAPLSAPPALMTLMLPAAHQGEEHPKVGGFSSSLFAFKTNLADDGKDVAGGWQAAVVTLRFVDARSLIPNTWTCRMRYEVPIRTSQGPLSPAEAAAITAEVATDASVNVMKTMPSWPVAELYCIRFQKEMLDIFKQGKYRWVGARVIRV